MCVTAMGTHMRAVVGVVALVFVAAAAGQAETATGQQPVRLSLNEAIATAVANSPVLATARIRVQRAQDQVREATAQGRPKLSANGSYLRTTPIATFTIPGPGGEQVTIQTRLPSQTTAQATIAQPIFITGGLSAAKRVAKLQVGIQTFGEAQTLQQLIADVKNAYYGILRAQGSVDVTQSAINVAQERLRLARAQFEAGVSAKFDVTRAEVDVANLQQTLIQATNGVLVAKAALNHVLGVDVNRPVEVEEQKAAVEPVTVDIEASTGQALEARPEMQQARLGVELAEHTVQLIAKQDDPVLSLSATTDWTANTSTFSPNKTTYTYGASVTWPIWTGGVTKAKVAQAKDDLATAKQNLEQAKLGVTLDVRTAALGVIESSERVGTAHANVVQAEEALSLARARYQAGVSTEVEVISAEAALTQALTNEVNARYDFLSAKAQLERATASQPEYGELTAHSPAAVAGKGVGQ